MNSLHEIFWRLFEEAGAARAYFHTWWALRNMALPEYFDTMDDYGYVDFFHVANSGNFKLIFLSLAKIYDRDSRTTGLKVLKRELLAAGYNDLVESMDRQLGSHVDTIKKVKSIRNKSVAHNESELSRNKVYELAGVTADQVRALIDTTCNVLNETAERLGKSNVISDGERHEQAVLKMLETLKIGRT